jgi:hypothetical protein
MHIFAATATLIIESRRQDKQDVSYNEYIAQGRQFLDLIKPENIVAREALKLFSQLDADTAL